MKVPKAICLANEQKTCAKIKRVCVEPTQNGGFVVCMAIRIEEVDE